MFTRFLEYTTIPITVQSYTLHPNGSFATLVNHTFYQPAPTQLRMDKNYSKVEFVFLNLIIPTSQVSTVCSLTMLHIIPLICLAYLNYAIYWAIRWIFYYSCFLSLFILQIQKFPTKLPEQKTEKRPCCCHCSHHYCWSLHPLSQPKVCHQHGGVVDRYQRWQF